MISCQGNRDDKSLIVFGSARSDGNTRRARFVHSVSCYFRWSRCRKMKRVSNIFLVVCFLMCSFVGEISMAKQIDEKHALKINGSEQWIFVRGNSDKPILLFVHGGPGFPFTPIARAFEQPFRNDFLIVHWDQRGVGKSFKTTDFSKGFTIDQFVQDGLAVTQSIINKYGTRRILLVGHSWGTVLGIKMVTTESSLFHAYISVGSNTDSRAMEQYRYQFMADLLKVNGELADLQILKNIGMPPWSMEQFDRWAEILMKHVPFEWTWGPIPRSNVDARIKPSKSAES
jgi:L-proline amide hydrolase